MKKVILFIVIIAIVAGVVAILLANKAKNQAMIKSAINLSTIPVTATKVTMQKIDESLSIVGTLYGNTEISVLSETQGRIVEVYANIGCHLSKGDPIVKVDDELKQASVLSAQANYDKAKCDYERYKILNQEKSINDAQLEATAQAFKLSEAQLIIAKRQLNDTKITAPFSGVVTARPVELGTVVSQNTPIITLVDISTLKLKVNLSENDVFKLKIGELIDLKTDVYPNEVFKAKIKTISDKADDSHTYPVEIVLPNSREYPLKSGMFARVYFNTIKKDESIIIPRNALIGSVRNPQVYIVENNVAKLKNIVVGAQIGNNLEVTKGLSSNDMVITSGQINLKDNSPVTITE